ncbi:permease-like cell division protein FtsX [Ruminococcus sp. NK3A76]|uniref:permease-like cell division protein FtsX n=1 Tax=Ruminococcus sp. NK3A76 TaxID=877411 RepID=UPI00048EACEF|nr:permease-like cell division protein FtsX [Ruminococcus sp. NK3A76]
MRFSSMRYLVGQGFKSIWKNRMMSFASFCIILVSLLMVGLSALASINLSKIINGIEDKSEAIVVIKDDITQEEKDELTKEITRIPNVNELKFYSKEEAWKSMVEDMPKDEQDLFKYADDNPLPDTFKMTVVDIKKMSETTAQISSIKNVDSVKSPTSFTDMLISIQRVVTVISAAIIIALVLVCLIIISNTTRASVFTRRKEINIMKYVGATNTFIKIPFFIEGMIVGIIAAACALFLTQFAYEGVYKIFSTDFSLWAVLGMQNLYSFDSLFKIVAVSYAVAGALIGAVGTSISTGKHLKV